MHASVEQNWGRAEPLLNSPRPLRARVAIPLISMVSALLWFAIFAVWHVVG